MSLVNKTRVPIFKNFFVFIFITVLLSSFFISRAHAENFMVSSGTDNTTEVPTPLSASDIIKINTSDDNRFQNNFTTWPTGGSYDESKYIEFIFEPNIPENAIINEVYLTHEFRRSGALSGAKLQVWDGAIFHDEILTVGSINIDHTDTTPNLAYLNTMSKVNNLKVRFLAYRGAGGNTKTSHDFLGLVVNYTLPIDEEDNPDPSPGTVILNDITSNTTWTKEGSPYVINEDITVSQNATLTIDPGVLVEFNASIFFVEGVIKVLGTENDPVYFDGYTDFVITDTSGNSVLNNIINRSNLLILYDGGFITSLGLDTDEDIYFFQSNSHFSNLKSHSLYLYDNSQIEIQDSNLLGQSSSHIEVQNYSTIVIKNSKIESANPDNLISVFNNSSVSFDDVDIVSLSQANSNLSVFANSTASFKNSISQGSRDGVVVYADSSISIENSQISCGRTGITVYDNSVVDFDTGSVDCDIQGVLLFNDVQANFEKIKVSNASDSGFMIYGNAGNSIVNITDSEITDNLYGFIVYNSVFSANNNNIHNNILSGAFTFTGVDLDFKNNYWGHASGPHHTDSNDQGAGDPVSDHILFSPWLTSWPPIEECTENCNSNIMFFPGVQGSSMYGEVFNCDGGIIPTDTSLCGEQKLWVSNNKILQEHMFLGSLGKSKNNIYTKNDTESIQGDGGETGVIDSALTVSIYKSFINDLREWKNEHDLINDYALIPYDWRLSLEDIITNGRVVGENLSYLNSGDFSESFILNKLRQLESTSRTGKVTLIAHSTGGLVIKALVQKLKDTNDPLYEKIDKIIFIAVPQVGTPEATIAMLHGVPLGPFGMLMPSERSREFGENMPTIYNLAPSSKYFDTVDANQNPILTFPDHPLFQDIISKYGNSINTKIELKDFVLGGDGRLKPDADDTDKPNIVNTYLYEQAENIHNIIDAWQPSSSTKIIEIAGWGEETKVGLKYVIKKKFFGLGGEYISHKPILSIDGDSTVAFPSALWMENNENVEEWVVDLFENNKNSIFGEDHKNILEILELRNFIKSKIQNLDYDESQKIIIMNNLSLLSTEPRLHFTLHSPLTLGITDIEGRYTGLDPVTKEIKQEIPDVNYHFIGTVQFISVPVGVPYTLKLVGYEEGSFTLDVEKQEGNNIIEEYYFEAIPTSDQTLAYLDIGEDFDVMNAELKVDIDGDGEIDETYPKVTESTEVEPTTIVPPPPGAVVFINNNPRRDPVVIKEEVVFDNENVGVVLGLETEIAQSFNTDENPAQTEEEILIQDRNVNVAKLEEEQEEFVINNEIETSVDVLKEKEVNKNVSFYVIIFVVLLSSFVIKRFIKI